MCVCVSVAKEPVLFLIGPVKDYSYLGDGTTTLPKNFLPTRVPKLFLIKTTIESGRGG